MQKTVQKGRFLMKNKLDEKKKGKMLCDKCREEKKSLVLLLFEDIIIFICEECLGPNLLN